MKDLETTFMGNPETAFGEQSTRELFDALKAIAVSTNSSVRAEFEYANGDRFIVSYQRAKGAAI